jgi:hypothetical protein
MFDNAKKILLKSGLNDDEWKICLYELHDGSQRVSVFPLLLLPLIQLPNTIYAPSRFKQICTPNFQGSSLSHASNLLFVTRIFATHAQHLETLFHN